jgi:hypothetical protein
MSERNIGIPTRESNNLLQINTGISQDRTLRAQRFKQRDSPGRGRGRGGRVTTGHVKSFLRE